MLRIYKTGSFILTVTVVNALFIGSALAFQRGYPPDNKVRHQEDTRINATKNSWSRGGIRQEVINNRKSDAEKTTKKGSWFRGGLRHDVKAENTILVNK